MSEYVARVTLIVNGVDITDFKSVEEKEHELHKQVNLMNKTGHISVTPRYGVNVEYVVPTTGEFDFEGVKNATLVISRTDSTEISYSGVYTLKIGALKYDGEKEGVRQIEFGAEAKV